MKEQFVKYEFFVSTGRQGSRRSETAEIPLTELNECKSEEEKEDLVQDYFTEWLWTKIDSGYNEVD